MCSIPDPASASLRWPAISPASRNHDRDTSGGLSWLYPLLEAFMGQPVFLGNCQGISEPVGRPSLQLVRAQRRIVGHDLGDDTDGLLVQRREFIHEGHAHAQRIEM